MSTAIAFVAYVAFFAWLDWITHRSIAFIVIVGGLLVAGYFARGRIGAAVRRAEPLRPLVEAWDRVPPPVQRLVLALTPLLYFLIRGQGTSGAGGSVLIAALMVAVAAVFLVPLLDRPLAGFYAGRNRFLPRIVRMLLAPALGVLIAFLIVHGSLADLPALFGGTTNSPQSPIGLGGRLFVATLLAGLVGVALLREGETT